MLQLLNTSSSFGWLHIALHWFTALLVMGLFALGLWMVDLSYYDSWYRTAPFWHKSFGVVVLFLTMLRLVSLCLTSRPSVIAHSPLERVAAKLTHTVLYVFLICIPISGYLISTADGRALNVFDFFSLPAVLPADLVDEDLAGLIHEYLAWSLIVLVVLHVIAALKHHFKDKDATLMRMLNPVKPESNNNNKA